MIQSFPETAGKTNTRYPLAGAEWGGAAEAGGFGRQDILASCFILLPDSNTSEEQVQRARTGVASCAGPSHPDTRLQLGELVDSRTRGRCLYCLD